MVRLGFKHPNTLALNLHMPASPQTRVTCIIRFNHKDQQNKQNRNLTNRQTLQPENRPPYLDVLFLSALLGVVLVNVRGWDQELSFSPHPLPRGHMHFLGAGRVLEVQAWLFLFLYSTPTNDSFSFLDYLQ